MWSCSINCRSTIPRSHLSSPAQKACLIGQYWTVRAPRTARNWLQPAGQVTGRKGLPDGVVSEMEDPRCKIAAIQVEDPRCIGILRGVVIEMEDPRCRGLFQGVLLKRAAIEMEDPRCRHVGIEMEDPRCRNLGIW